MLDVIGYACGRLIPFSCQSGWEAQVAPDPSLPGFFESLEGLPVGAAATISVRLPDDAPAEWLRGQAAQLLVEVRRAFEVEPLDRFPRSGRRAWARRTWTRRWPRLHLPVDELRGELDLRAGGDLVDRALDELAPRLGLALLLELARQPPGGASSSRCSASAPSARRSRRRRLRAGSPTAPPGWTRSAGSGRPRG